jgi:uncharacterized protein (TIGR03435 family)
LIAQASRYILIVIGVGTMPAQTTDQRTAFEVASVKLSKPDRGGLMVIQPMPGGETYIARNVSLRMMIKAIYKITDSQIAGGPDWTDTEHYDIDAKAERPSTIDELHEMFRTLLMDRFQLRFHQETRTLPAHVLAVAKSGTKLKRSESQEALGVPIKPSGPGRITGERVSMSYLAWYLSLQLGTPVVDGTALEGFFDFTLFWSPNPGLNSPGVRYRDDTANELDIFAALEDQLGLKIESVKAPVNVFVIDQVAKPNAN